MQHLSPHYADTLIDPPPPNVHHHHHHHDQHPTYTQVRVKYEAGCFGGGGFPEDVPLEIRGRVSDVDYVSHIRHLNSDLSRASRWGWGVLLCFLGLVGCIIATAVSLFYSFADGDWISMSKVGTTWPWALVAGFFLVGMIIVRAAKDHHQLYRSYVQTNGVLRHHERLFNEGLGGETGLLFRVETKVKDAKAHWDPVFKRHIKPRQVKTTLVIDVGPADGEPQLQPATPALDNPHTLV